MYRLDLPREEADAVLVSADMDADPGVTLHTFGHVRNSTDDHWIDVAFRQHMRAGQEEMRERSRECSPGKSFALHVLKQCFAGIPSRRFVHLSFFSLLLIPLSICEH